MGRGDAAVGGWKLGAVRQRWGHGGQSPRPAQPPPQPLKLRGNAARRHKCHPGSPKFSVFTPTPRARCYGKAWALPPSLLPAGVRIPENFGWKGSGDELKLPKLLRQRFHPRFSFIYFYFSPRREAGRAGWTVLRKVRRFYALALKKPQPKPEFSFVCNINYSPALETYGSRFYSSVHLFMQPLINTYTSAEPSMTFIVQIFLKNNRSPVRISYSLCFKPSAFPLGGKNVSG